MNLKKIGKVFACKFVGTGPSSYKKKNLPGCDLTEVEKHCSRRMWNGNYTNEVNNFTPEANPLEQITENNIKINKKGLGYRSVNCLNCHNKMFIRGILIFPFLVALH